MSEVPKITTPVIWVLGGPGSGKGTQCAKIVEKYGLAHVSSGDLLRAEVASGSDRGKELSSIMERGELVPNSVVIELLREAMRNVTGAKGFLIDGYPREKQQGIEFELQIANVSVVLFFEANEDVLTTRLLARGVDSGRVDDNEETIKKRLVTFNTYTQPLIDHYALLVKKIDANRGTDEVFTEVCAHLDPIFKEAE